MTAPPFGSGERAVWNPGERELDRARLVRLMAHERIDGLPALHARALADPEWWWRTAVADLGLEFSAPFSRVRGESEDPRLPSWFQGGRLNLADTCVDRWADGAHAGRTAVAWEDENGRTRELSYGDLAEQSRALAAYLRSIGIEPGDRVGLFVPMTCETIVAFIACARVGAVMVPAFTGYGPDPLRTRFVGCGARVVICADGFVRRGGVVAMKGTVDAALEDDSGVERVIVIEHTGVEAPLRAGRDVSWAQALAAGRASAGAGDSQELCADHPLLIVYTSGTTGTPKGIVHSHGGFLAKVAVDWGYSFDIQDDDVLLWSTDLGWALGPMLIVASLALGATMVLYEGSPDRPDLGRLWELAARWRATTVGVAPSLVRAMMQQGPELVTAHDRSSLRAFVSTGEPWSPEAWNWLFEIVGERRVPIINFSGGTEVGGGILTCYTIAPIAPCAFAGPVVGVDADVVDPRGVPLTGETGELVLRDLFPGITHGFWRDRERYLETYWSTWPELWHHGDLATHDADGWWFIQGRSDDTIKVSGKRIGPAEIEAVLARHDAVADAIVVGVPDERTGSAIICFVVPAAGRDGVDEQALSAELAALIASHVDKTLRPRAIHCVSELPRTRTGKLMRRVARARYLGLPQGDLSSIESAGAVEAIPTLAART